MSVSIGTSVRLGEVKGAEVVTIGKLKGGKVTGKGSYIPRQVTLASSAWMQLWVSRSGQF